MNKRRKGAAHEQAAKVYLEKRGVRIQTINYRVRQGEIDIVGYEKGTLVFFEVKYRANAGNGLPQEAVSVAKQRQICRVALFYLNQYHIPEQQPVRYDVIAILGNEITWIRNAFLHQICDKSHLEIMRRCDILVQIMSESKFKNNVVLALEWIYDLKMR